MLKRRAVLAWKLLMLTVCTWVEMIAMKGSHGASTSGFGGEWTGAAGMVQQVSQMMPSAPRDGGLAHGEAVGASGGPQGDGLDFLALLTQTEMRGIAVPPGDARMGVASAGARLSSESLADSTSRAEALADDGPAALPGGVAAFAAPAMTVAVPSRDIAGVPLPDAAFGLDHAAAAATMVVAAQDTGGPSQATPNHPQPAPAWPISGSPHDASGLPPSVTAFSAPAMTVAAPSSGIAGDVGGAPLPDAAFLLDHAAAGATMVVDAQDAGGALQATPNHPQPTPAWPSSGSPHDASGLPDSVTAFSAPAMTVAAPSSGIAGDIEGVAFLGARHAPDQAATAGPAVVKVQDADESPQAAPVPQQPSVAASQPISGWHPVLSGAQTSLVTPSLYGMPGIARYGTPAGPAASPVQVWQGEGGGGDGTGPARAASHAQDMPNDHVFPVEIQPDPTFPRTSAGGPPVLIGPATTDPSGLSLLANTPLSVAAPILGQSASGTPHPPALSTPALPYLRAFHLPLSAQLAPTLLAMDLASGTNGTPARLTVAIRPAELGTLQIVAERAEDQVSRIAVLAERPETLQLLLRDAPSLETALRAAGIGQGAGLSLSFDLASQGQSDRGWRPDGKPGPGDDAGTEPAAIPRALIIGRAGLIDLSL